MWVLVLLPLMLPPALACLPAAGVLVMLHRCGRNAEDFWPPSEVCPQCIGESACCRTAGLPSCWVLATLLLVAAAAAYRTSPSHVLVVLPPSACRHA